MHTHSHFMATIGAAASAAVAGGALVAAITGSTPEYLSQAYVAEVVALIGTIASAIFALKNREPVEPAA